MLHNINIYGNRRIEVYAYMKNDHEVVTRISNMIKIIIIS